MGERPSLCLTQDDLERLSQLLDAQGGPRVLFENETTGERREVTLVYPR